MLDELVKWLKALLGDFVGLPHSSIIVLALGVAMALISSLITRIFIDAKAMRSCSREIREWEMDKLRALREKDKKLLLKVKKREPYIAGLKAQVMRWNMVTMLVFMSIWFLFITIFTGVFGENPVARSPFPLGGKYLNFFLWFIISSYSMSIIQRVLGVRPE